MNNGNKVLIGAIFIFISSVLISAQFITSAILSINRNIWSEGSIYQVFYSAGYLLVILSVVSLLVGLIFMLSVLKNKE